MKLRIHICNDAAQVKYVKDLVEGILGEGAVQFDEMLVPDLMVRDHRQNVSAPPLLNKGAICVVYEVP